uniref:CHK kinase-like domain-containing protein n=1 Tax=Anopheles christyi TaxID=43041 RepID=A0A182JXB0_9DIPT
MNQEPFTYALSQISHLVSNVNKKNTPATARQLAQLVKDFGLEADRHLLRCLFSSIDFGDATHSASRGYCQARLLATELASLTNKPQLVANVCFAVDNPFPQQKSLKPTSNLLPQISKTLSCTPIQETALSIALLNSEHPEIVRLAEAHLKNCLTELIESYIESDSGSNLEGSLNDVSPEFLQQILSLISYGKHTTFGLTDQTYERFRLQLCRDFPRDRVPLILAPLLYTENSEISAEILKINTHSILQSSIMKTSWTNLVVEVGYSFTATLDDCRNHLLKVGGRDITPQDVAKIVSSMCLTHETLSESSINLPTPSAFWPQGSDPSGQKGKDGNGGSSASENTTWKPEVLVQALKEVVPSLNWKEVCLALDHAEFMLKDRAGLSLLLTIVKMGMQACNLGQNFPVECLYQRWTNVEGQLSIISQILKNPDLYTFADHIYTAVSLDLLKTPPETDSKEVATWMSLHLVDVLLYIADHANLSEKVMKIFKVPGSLCPDILFLALLQISPPMTTARQELFTNLVPIFLGNHPNAGTILHHAWNHSTFNVTLRPIILHAMSDWYMVGEGDQSRLSRILDVAQDLKALSNLLNIRTYMFIIDLACLASRREYLKLEKWLADKIRDHGEPFVKTILKFLQRRCPQIMGGKYSEEQIPKSSQLPPETLITILNCLQACIGNCTPEVAEMIHNMTQYGMLLNSKTRVQQQQQQQQQQAPQQQPPPPGVLRSHRGLEAFGANAMGSQLLPPMVDSLNSLTANIGGLSIGGPGGGNSAFSFNNIIATPASPSRLLPSSSPFPMMPLPPGAAAAAAAQAGTLGRLQQTPNDKLGAAGGAAGIPNPAITPSPFTTDTALPVSKEVEDEANSYFQRIYNLPPHPTLSIDEVLDMLQRYKDSPNRHENDVYQCMLRNLFEEYKFFPQYPDKELQTTAQLFGGMVERNLVTTYVALGLALRCVLDALKKQEGSKMYYFGITALDRFKNKLHLYPKYCEYVHSIAHFSEFPAHLIEYIEYGSQSQEPPNKTLGPGPLPPSILQFMPSGTSGRGPVGNPLYRSNSVTGTSNLTLAGVSTSASAAAAAAAAAAGTGTGTPGKINLSAQLIPPGGSGVGGGAGGAGTSGSSGGAGAGSAGGGGGQPPRVKSIANATNIDTLLVATQDREEKITAPPDAIQDKTAFIFNNLSQINLQQKCEEIKEILQKDYYTWLAQYLVLKRASIEVNFHVLYSNFLDALKIQEINRLVTKETFRNIRVLLRSDKGIANFSDRSLLKNLGHWLGMMTLGRNKPILHLDIDVKSLLVEAYNKGQQELLYVVPFVAKVLESCAKSKVFKPPNPWTMSIMNLLAELHQEPDLKLNLKFEIEVLCKNLNIDVSDLKPAIYLKDPERAQNIEYQLSQPKPPKETPAAVMPGGVGAGVSGMGVGGNAGGGGVVSVVPQLPPGPEDMGTSGPSSSPANVAMDAALAATGPPEPRFHYSDINIANPSLNAQHIVYHPTVVIVHTQSHLKVIVKSCLERTISEWISLIVDRSVKIASKTTEQIVRKDFALDSDETRMRRSAHNMARSLVAGMAMITCREQMLQTIQNNIKAGFLTAVSHAQKDMIESAAAQLAIDNIELVSAFIQKTAIEKVAVEMDKILAEDFQLRKLARQEGRRYWDASVLSYQAERMPERIRLNVGGVSPSQLAVYEEFSRNIPGFLPITERDAAQFAPKMAEMIPFVATPDEIGAMYDELASKMDTFIKTTRLVPILQVHTNNMEQLLECLIHAHRSLDNLTGCTLLNKAVEGLLEGLVNIPDQLEHIKLYRDIHLRVMRLMQDNRLFGPMWTNKAITRYMVECREELRYNVEAVDLLISSNFVNMQQFDMMLVQLMDNGNNYVAVVFAMQLLQTFFIDERHNSVITENDLAGTIEMLHRLTAHPRAPEGLTHLIEMLRANHDPNSFLMDRTIVGPTSYIHAGVAQARSDIDDSPGFLERAEFLLKDWVSIALSPNTCRDPLKGFSLFVGKMNAHGILKGDEPLTRFFRFATQYCIDLTYRNMNEPNWKTKIFQFIDAYVRLIALLVKHSGESGSTNTKLNLLNKILGIVIGILLHDQEVHTTAFQQIGYHRIFAMLFLELTTHDPILENISISVITAFCHTYHILRPSAAPGFCYSWLELIAHRVFIGRVLALIPQQKGWNMYSQLLIDLFKYLAPFLRNAELAKPVQHLYKGTLRVLLVLLHDFPEFLCDYHFAFCDVIPSNCIQMRNLILSPYPRNMRLPDPFTPNLKVDMLNDIGGSPRISINYASSIQPASFKKDLDSYLKARAPVTFLSKNLGPTMSTIIHSAHMDIFQNLAVDLDTEGRYLFLNAIANQLRYPNSHTHYFSCCILYLFAEANSEAIQEQITRVLLERLIVNRPHPWGLLITFIELIKNPIYKFWDHDFVHCAPEIERLFESVAKSCMVASKSQQQIQNNNSLNMPSGDDVRTAASEKQLPTFLSATLLQQILAENLTSEPIHVDSFSARIATKPGDNYSSDVFTIVIHYNGSKTIALVAKIMVDNETMKTFGESLGAFVKEVNTFRNLLPAFSEIVSGAGGLEKFGAKCFYASRDPLDTIVFEDLKVLGYRMPDRTRGGLDLAHCALIMRKIGVFHAASMVYVARGTTERELFTNLYAHGMVRPGDDEDNHPALKMFINGLEKFLQVSAEWPELKRSIWLKLEALKPDYRRRIVQCLLTERPEEEEEVTFRVLNHGDLWSNNMMFRYDNDDDGTTVRELIFVDYQLSSYGSPGLDLVYCLHNCPQLDVRENHTEQLLRLYHESLCEGLRSGGYCQQSFPSFADVWKEYERHEFIGKLGFFFFFC